LAANGLNEAMYTIGKDLYQEIIVQKGQGTLLKSANEFKSNTKGMMKLAYSQLAKAASEKIYSAYFLLGLMHIEGIYAVKSVEKGINYLERGAAMNNAYCFYYLSMLYNEGQLVEKNPTLEFLYLKRAAEEGFVQMQH
jgi:TPR repeat protein